ncbi:hypothetical protein LOK49_LG09G01349 [Camellia lanceoleosa]|uniref:Uncharacterized protein n=1 Tax=Camellia lanceoleosa TaxID=1840588 RepID=A0ACC0GH49_9ERIC|nr:hypothetical protein LOK49_LG09G01349 [Camellia lanceoleosa]
MDSPQSVVSPFKGSSVFPEPEKQNADPFTRNPGCLSRKIGCFYGLELPTEAKANLLELTPRTYVGAAVELARAVDMAVNSVNRLRYWTDTENNCK